jgi:hypothetical protein
VLKTHSRLNSELQKELSAICEKDWTRTNTQDGTGIPTKRQTRQRATKNKMDSPTTSSGLSFNRIGPEVLHLSTFMTTTTTTTTMMMMMLDHYLVICTTQRNVQRKNDRKKGLCFLRKGLILSDNNYLMSIGRNRLFRSACFTYCKKKDSPNRPMWKIQVSCT